jgi:Secretion system C-terminal sorting domain
VDSFVLAINHSPMKTRVHLFSVLILGTLPTSAQQLTNGGFEAWTNQFAFSQLNEWSTSNWLLPNVANVTQLVDAPSGLYAAHLETHIMDEDTIFGFIILGDFVDDAPTQGVPFTTEVDRITGWYRYDLQPGDSALIAVGMWANEILFSFDAHTIGGSQPVWTAFDLPLNMGDPLVPDSVVVAVTSSSPFAPDNMQNSSWIDVDALALVSTSVPVGDALPNYDMEDWTDISSEEPDGWGTFNAPLIGAGLVPVTKSTNAHGESFSARLETLNLGADTLPGAIANSAITFTGAVQGQPFNEIPLTLDGWFRYEPSGTDTAVVYALFTQNGGPVGSVGYQITEEALTWTPFSAPVIMLIPPDTLTLVVFAGDNPGSALFLDDLSFDGLFSEVRYMEKDQAFLFPNPASEQVSIHVPGDMRGQGRLRLTDAQGRMIIEQSIADMGNGLLRLPVSELASGRYVVELVNVTRTERLIFVRQ